MHFRLYSRLDSTSPYRRTGVLIEGDTIEQARELLIKLNGADVRLMLRHDDGIECIETPSVTLS